MSRFNELKARYPNLIPVHELRAAISILELAQYYGYVLQPRKGKSRPVLTHPFYQDTIVIKLPQHPHQQLYQRAGDFSDAGTLVDFICHRLTTVFADFQQAHLSPFRCAINVLYDYLRIDLHPQPTGHILRLARRSTDQALDTGFSIDDFDLQPLQQKNYLIRRLITWTTLERPEFWGKVLTQITYFDPVTKQTRPFNLVKNQPHQHYRQFSNVAFPYYNGLSPLASGLELRNDTIKLHAPGSDRIQSVFVSNPPSITQCFVITESVIDALSHQQLRNSRGDKAFDTVYFATGGQITPQQINTIICLMGTLPKATHWTLELAFDNDLKGHYYDLLFIQQLTTLHFPLTPLPGGPTHYHYRMPQGDGFSTLRQKLMEQVNTETTKSIQLSATLAGRETKPQITIESPSQRDSQPARLCILATSPALRAMSEALLTITGFDQHVRIRKASGKDLNEDLANIE